MPTTVYHSRSRTTRNRLLVAAGVAVLVLTGFLIGRAQTGEEPAAAVPASGSPASGSPASGSPASGSPASGSPVPAVPSEPVDGSPPTPTGEADVGGIDAYTPLQVEDAAAVSGVEMQDTADEGGGRNAGWINGGDWLRFDEVNFGTTPPASVNVRVASESPASGRLEIRVDSPDAEPAATLSTSHTGGWQNWRTETTPMAPVTGLHTVYVTFGNDRPDDFVNVNWLVFRR